MPKKIRQLKARLRHAGFVEAPGRGSHVNFWHPQVAGTFVTISGNDGHDAQRYHETAVDKVIRRAEAAFRQRGER